MFMLNKIKKINEDLYVIFDCRRRIKQENKNGHLVNTKFLAMIASVPEWTITIFNKQKPKKIEG